MGPGFTPTHTAPHTNTRCGSVVSPAAAQLIQALDALLSAAPRPTIPHRLPIPGDHTASLGTHILGSRHRASSWGWGWGGRMRGRGRNLRGGFIKEERNKVELKRQRREEKVEGEVSGGYLSHSLSYTKVPRVPVILETEAGLKSKRLSADGDEAMVT